jgi:hypothetical protein
MYQKMV